MMKVRYFNFCAQHSTLRGYSSPKQSLASMLHAKYTNDRLPVHFQLLVQKSSPNVMCLIERLVSSTTVSVSFFCCCNVAYSEALISIMWSLKYEPKVSLLQGLALTNVISLTSSHNEIHRLLAIFSLLDIFDFTGCMFLHSFLSDFHSNFYGGHLMVWK